MMRAQAETNPRTQIAGSEKCPIKIGFVTSLSGVSESIGKDMVDGMRLALLQHDYVACGHKLELLVENDASYPATAITKLRKLIEQDKVDVVSGFLMASVGYAVAPVADQYDTPLVMSSAAGDDSTQRKHYKMLLRLVSTSSQSTMPLGQWVYQKLKYRRIVCIGMDYPYGWESIGGFQKTFEAAGGKVVQKVWAPLGLKNFSNYIKSIHSDADAVLIAANGDTNKIFAKQYSEFGPKLPILGTPTTFDECYLPESGQYLEGGYSSGHYSSALTTKENREFVRLFTSTYKRVPGYHDESAYVTGLWIIKAIEKVKGDTSDRERFLAALKKIQLDAPSGPMRLDDHGQVVHNIYIQKLEKVGGKLQNTVVATYPSTSQFWKFSPTDYLKQPLYSRDNPACRFCEPE